MYQSKVLLLRQVGNFYTLINFIFCLLMATSNFNSPQGTDCIYAFCMEDEDFEDTYDCIKWNVVSSLESLGFSLEDVIKSWSDEWIASLTLDAYDNKYKERSTVEINCYTETGYYQWARFDYEVVINPDQPSKSILKKIASLCKKINKIYKENSIQLKVTARFSNGETWYEKV